MSAFAPPRPMFATLGNAVGAAIRCGNTVGDINPEKWADTYGCTPDDVRSAFLRAQTNDTNSVYMGEGK